MCDDLDKNHHLRNMIKYRVNLWNGVTPQEPLKHSAAVSVRTRLLPTTDDDSDYAPVRLLTAKFTGEKTTRLFSIANLLMLQLSVASSDDSHCRFSILSLFHL